ncbi:RDD family protein [Aestuariimicrobium sp. T2.26MG-19.2B]|uniref:RDD family protein n=1 Tax=Aestuariimicrobium sp. T2.26MG-19.2B TaxID=3040679 RepID=UPI00253FF27A|nr:RDD family protein [Aestuariimicrobium sp. T2.26MG-19.2B]
MTDHPQLPPMGWYPDPNDPKQERYWEGTRWTHNVRDPQPDGRWSSGLGAATGQSGSSRPTPQPSGQSSGQPWGSSSGQPTHESPVPHQLAPGATPGVQHPTQVPAGYALGMLRPATADGVPLASFGQRLLARLIDWFVVSAIALPLAYRWVREYLAVYSSAVSTGSFSNSIQLAEKIQGPVSAIALVWVAVMFAYQLLMVGLTSRTLGKMALGLRIVPVDRGRGTIGWREAIIRAVVVGGAALVDISVGIVTLVTCLAALQKPRCQALQDRLARTQVISTS